MADSDPSQLGPTWQETTDEARRRRIEALRDIAAHTPQAPASAAAPPPEAARPRPPLAPPRRSYRPRAAWLAAGTLMLVAVVLAVFVLTRPGTASTVHQKATPTAAGPLVIRPALNSLGCPSAVAWSGDGTQLAVLGTTTCDEQLGQGILNVYNFPAGKLIAHFQLDQAVESALGSVNTSGIHPLSVSYTHVLWLGPAIYVTFLVINATFTTDNTRVPFVGLLRANPSDTQPFAFVQPNSGGRRDVYMRWNPVTGEVRIARDTIVGPHVNVFASLPPSLAYGWRADGAPDPLAPIAADRRPPADPGGPIGDPAGSARLTIWQSGTVLRETGKGASAGVYLFSTDFAAISGGQPFLFDAVHLQGVLVPSGQPTPDKKSLAALQLSSAPWLPVRDAALQAVLDAQPVLVAVAWRPDGAVLAAHPGIPFDQNGQPTTTDITLYDTATGHVLGTLRPPGSISHTLNPLLWAPDGRALLMLDQEAGRLVIWSQTQLPH